MKKIIKYLLVGLKYFVIQTLGEVVFIIVLMYLGLPYADLSVGGEHLYEITIGILGFHAFFKSLIYGWFYLLVFIAIGLVRKDESEFQHSIVNGFLSMLLPALILIIRHLSFSEMANVFIATMVTSILIILFVKVIGNKRVT